MGGRCWLSLRFGLGEWRRNVFDNSSAILGTYRRKKKAEKTCVLLLHGFDKLTHSLCPLILLLNRDELHDRHVVYRISGMFGPTPNSINYVVLSLVVFSIIIQLNLFLALMDLIL